MKDHKVRRYTKYNTFDEVDFMPIEDIITLSNRISCEVDSSTA